MEKVITTGGFSREGRSLRFRIYTQSRGGPRFSRSPLGINRYLNSVAGFVQASVPNFTLKELFM